MAWLGAVAGAASSAYSSKQQGKGSTTAQQTPAVGANTLPQPPYMQTPLAQAGNTGMGNQGYLEYLMKMLQQGR